MADWMPKSAVPVSQGPWMPKSAVPVVPVSTGEAVQRGVEQGLTLGWSDELAGAAGAAQTSIGDWAYEKLHPEATKTPSFGARYQQIRDAERTRNSAASDQHPWAYGIPEGVGTVGADALATVATGGAALPLIAAGQGAIQGAGYSDAESGTGVARDAAAGGVLGLAGYGVGSALGKAGEWVAQKAGLRTAAAAGRAQAQAAKEVAEEIASARGQLGAETQKGNRLTEWVIRLLDEEKSGALTPTSRQLLDSLRASPEYGELLNGAAQSVAKNLPSQAATIATKDAALQSLTQGAPQAIADRATDLLKPQPGKDLVSLGKMYAEPIVGTVLGGAIGDQFDHAGAGSAVGQGVGLIFGRTRAGKAIRTRIERPGNSAALWGMLKSGAEGLERFGPYADTLRRAAARGADSLAASQYVLWNTDPQFRSTVSDAGEE